MSEVRVDACSICCTCCFVWAEVGQLSNQKRHPGDDDNLSGAGLKGLIVASFALDQSISLYYPTM